MNEKQTNNLNLIDDFFNKVYSMPTYVQEAMFAMESAEINWQIIEKYHIPEEHAPFVINALAETIIKDSPLQVFPQKIMEEAGINNPEIARNIALEFCLNRLLPLRNHLPGIENFIIQLGGTLPNILPTPPRVQEPAPPVPAYQQPNIVQKDIRSALIENQEIGNQIVTELPIRLRDYGQPVRPTIKNWLIDYQQNMGVEYHSPMERAQYLFNSANGRALNEQDREVVSALIKSYDERIPLPFDAITGILVLELIRPKITPRQENIEPPASQPKIIQAQAMPTNPMPQQPQQWPNAPTQPPPASQHQPAAVTSYPPYSPHPSYTPNIPQQPQAAPPQNLPRFNQPTAQPVQQTSGYQEPIEEKDIQGPAGGQRVQVPKATQPTEQKQTVKLDGNLINLKDVIK